MGDTDKIVILPTQLNYNRYSVEVHFRVSPGVRASESGTTLLSSFLTKGGSWWVFCRYKG